MIIKIVSYIFLLIAFSTAFAGKSSIAGMSMVTASKVQIIDFYDTFHVIGKCSDSRSRDYYANVSGKLEMVSEKQGKKIKKGEVLLIIDAEVAKAAKSYAQSVLDVKQRDYDRNVVMYAKKIISAQDLERSKSELENARSNYVQEKKIYDDMIVTAPFDGTVGVIKPRVGNDIKKGEYLFSIIDDEKIGNATIIIELPEFLVGKVSTNTGVIIGDSSHAIKAKIASVSRYLSDTGVLDAKIILSSNNNILHNSYVDVTLILNLHKGLAVPEESVQRNNEGYFIYKMHNNVVQQLYVKIGSRVNNLIEIVSKDIREGDQVVVQGVTKIRDGSEVRLIE